MPKKMVVMAAALMLTVLGPWQFSRGQNAAKTPQPQLKASDIDKMMSELSIPADVGACAAVCGDYQCDAGETQNTCPGDCTP